MLQQRLARRPCRQAYEWVAIIVALHLARYRDLKDTKMFDSCW